MAADAYLKAAAGDLQKAAQEVKRQMKEVQQGESAFEKETIGYIQNAESEIRATMAKMGANSNSETIDDVSAMSMHVANLKRLVEKKKQELNDHRKQAQRALADKQGAMNDLLNDASTLASKSGNPALK